MDPLDFGRCVIGQQFYPDWFSHPHFHGDGPYSPYSLYLQQGTAVAGKGCELAGTHSLGRHPTTFEYDLYSLLLLHKINVVQTETGGAT